ncbi:nucleotidyltransferase domain-containing protein [Candidatus Kuenenbacteria bacterium]|nr:nucleotidyltransferase domain-containing protein [Candidatus Kuenenbacteria bacterium]
MAQIQLKEKHKQEIEKIVNQIKIAYKPEKIILFGSFAFGQPKENSDIDLVVIKKTEKKFGARLFEVAKMIKSKLGTDVLVYTPKEWEKGLKSQYYFFTEIKNKGKLLYEKSVS